MGMGKGVVLRWVLLQPRQSCNVTPSDTFIGTSRAAVCSACAMYSICARQVWCWTREKKVDLIGGATKRNLYCNKIEYCNMVHNTGTTILLV